MPQSQLPLRGNEFLRSDLARTKHDVLVGRETPGSPVAPIVEGWSGKTPWSAR